MKKIKILITAVLTAVLILGGNFAYCEYKTKYKKTVIFEEQNKEFSLSIVQTGEPDFPFGSAHCRFDLSENGNLIAKYKFDVQNDGGNALKENFRTQWNENNVTVTVSAEEHPPVEYIIGFDGTVEKEESADN